MILRTHERSPHEGGASYVLPESPEGDLREPGRDGELERHAAIDTERPKSVHWYGKLLTLPR